MFQHTILLRNFLLDIPDPDRGRVPQPEWTQRQTRLLGTLLNNFLYYGYVPSREAWEALSALEELELKLWWEEIEPAFKAIKGDDKNIGDYVVYQNFPSEVLAMSEADYWIRQVLIYWAYDSIDLQKPKEPRPALFEEVDIRVLHRARPAALQNIFEAMLSKPAAWTDQDKAEILWFISSGFEVTTDIPFKENLVHAAMLCMHQGTRLPMDTTTDVLRLAAGLSGGDISLKAPTKFKLSRIQRRFVIGTLAGVKDLEEGVMRHRNTWIRLFHQLHVGEYQERYPEVCRVAQAIRNGKGFTTFNARVEALIEARDPAVLDLMATRPGEFARRVVHLCSLFGEVAVDRFIPVMNGMSTMKLLKLKRFLFTLNDRQYRIFTPKGNWKKAQIVENTVRIAKTHRNRLLRNINELVQARTTGKFGEEFRHDPRLSYVKLPTNDAEAATRFPKGTVLLIPDNIRFIRTATYWQEKNRVCWMDNGWNFFDKNWKSKGTCCWNLTHQMDQAAVFSGDPVNVYDNEGKAAQMIDLYFEQLLKKKVRYAVWNILSYSRIPFDEVGDVRGLMMLGEDAKAGKLLEPSRVNFSIPITGGGLSKYVCYVDIQERKIVICDSGLAANVSSAGSNAQRLEGSMPALVEYLDALPSLRDILELFPNSDTDAAIKVLYSDENVRIKDEKAFVFIPKNDHNSFDPLSLEDFLTG